MKGGRKTVGRNSGRDFTENKDSVCNDVSFLDACLQRYAVTMGLKEIVVRELRIVFSIFYFDSIVFRFFFFFLLKSELAAVFLFGYE